jgi:hypothetical protein
MIASFNFTLPLQKKSTREKKRHAPKKKNVRPHSLSCSLFVQSNTGKLALVELSSSIVIDRRRRSVGSVPINKDFREVPDRNTADGADVVLAVEGGTVTTHADVFAGEDEGVDLCVHADAAEGC